MRPVMQSMHIRQTITCFAGTETLQDISEIAAGLRAVRGNIIRFKSKREVDLFLGCERHYKTALFRILLILISVPYQSNFSVVRITKLCEVICFFYGADYRPFVQVCSFNNTTGWVGNTE